MEIQRICAIYFSPTGTTKSVLKTMLSQFGFPKIGNKKCTSCGSCSKLCPTHAITNPRKKAGSTCIRCMRCIKICPQKARTYGKIKEMVAKLFLIIVSHGEKQSEFFA